MTAKVNSNPLTPKSLITNCISITSKNSYDFLVDTNDDILQMKIGNIELKAVQIEQLPAHIIENVHNNIGQPVSLNNVPCICYSHNACHANSLIFSHEVRKKVTIIEGIVVNEDGFAFEHFWNRIYLEGNNVADCDITFSAIASQEEIKIKKSYYPVNEYTKEDMINRIKTNKIFSDEILSLMETYYIENPAYSNEYHSYRETLDNQNDK